jgi:hypothetical protein
LGKDGIGTNAQDLGILGFKLGIGVRTGRFKALDSSWAKIEHVKVD